MILICRNYGHGWTPYCLYVLKLKHVGTCSSQFSQGKKEATSSIFPRNAFWATLLRWLYTRVPEPNTRAPGNILPLVRIVIKGRRPRCGFQGVAKSCCMWTNSSQLTGPLGQKFSGKIGGGGECLDQVWKILDAFCSTLYSDILCRLWFLGSRPFAIWWLRYFGPWYRAEPRSST